MALGLLNTFLEPNFVFLINDFQPPLAGRFIFHKGVLKRIHATWARIRVAGSVGYSFAIGLETSAMAVADVALFLGLRDGATTMGAGGIEDGDFGLFGWDGFGREPRDPDIADHTIGMSHPGILSTADDGMELRFADGQRIEPCDSLS